MLVRSSDHRLLLLSCALACLAALAWRRARADEPEPASPPPPYRSTVRGPAPQTLVTSIDATQPSTRLVSVADLLEGQSGVIRALARRARLVHLGLDPRLGGERGRHPRRRHAADARRRRRDRSVGAVGGRPRARRDLARRAAHRVRRRGGRRRHQPDHAPRRARARAARRGRRRLVRRALRLGRLERPGRRALRVDAVGRVPRRQRRLQLLRHRRHAVQPIGRSHPRAPQQRLRPGRRRRHRRPDAASGSACTAT